MRSRIENFKIALSNADLPSLPEWQAALDRCDLLIPIELTGVHVGPDELCAARIQGQRFTFTCERRAVADVVGEHHPSLAREWTFAYAFRGTGGLVPSACGFIAAISYALATNGVFYSPGLGSTRNFDNPRHAFDASLAAVFSKADLYRSRYPASDEEEGSGTWYVGSRVL